MKNYNNIIKNNRMFAIGWNVNINTAGEEDVNIYTDLGTGWMTINRNRKYGSSVLLRTVT